MKWKIRGAERNEEDLVITTDGSCRKVRGRKRTGAGVVIKKGENTIWCGSWGLGRRSNTYDSESFTLAVGMLLTKHLADDDPHINSIKFYSNSSLAISNISLTHTHPSQQLSRGTLKFLEKNNDSHIHITWVPGHKGLEINKLADREAKCGCQREDSIQVSLSYHKERATKLVLKGW